MIALSSDAEAAAEDPAESTQEKQYRNLVFYICLWLEVTWIAAVFSDLLGLSLPYLFRFVARYTNSAQQRYWRVLKFLRRPIAFLGTTLVTFIFFAACISENELLAVNANKGPDDFGWDDAIAYVLQIATLWVVFYALEKVMISYVTVHYHYRGNNSKLARTKHLHNALITLYDASTYLHPPHRGMFDEEDTLIRNAKGDAYGSGRVRVTSYLARLGIDGYKMTSLFGNFISDDPQAHWLRPASTYSTIERAWANPVSAEALARRIWLSLAAEGRPGLTADDIGEVLGPYRKDEAVAIFKTLKDDSSSDIRIEEFIGIVTDGGKTRHDIYRNMDSMDHCLNTFDWFCLLILAAVMIFFILVSFVPVIKTIQTVLASVAIGLSVAMGRTFTRVILGIFFVFFDHPFDIGDVVNVYNPGSTVGTMCAKRIENFTRCGLNRQGLSVFVDFRTGFKDVVRLRTILEDFLAQNSRDYVPDSLGLNVVSLHELNKMELRLAFTHRNNWSDEKLRSQRSNKFHCALVAACRAIPLYKPGGMLPAAGENGNPTYTVNLAATTELTENIKKEKDRRQGLRWDNVLQDVRPDLEPGPSRPETNGSGDINTTKQAGLTEEEAYLKLARLPALSRRAGLSTSVDVPVLATGLRQTMRSSM
ncbi:Mechanosensitive ion channel protein Msy2 [Colletotrichum orbiculare MAFF 240422]|uniref:Mechanosensitive ion channel protein Msy2 n=1 Tax=Colletotrichum orbiculare (strain 104-T / ATCC 96160 / CBS 514.97 / LARS 414 / MAFF 240422) TaxID=1213857 RepID=A0A484FCE1_COLOR|nr:Mechanosensitive ion channel protein Msy2 [Colletotrichum orbiculare MAFF 240422]